MEVAVGDERLGDQLRADHLPVAVVEQAAGRLPGEGELGQAPDQRRIQHRAEDERHQAGGERPDNLAEHDDRISRGCEFLT